MEESWLRVNVLGVVGGSLGLVSLFLVWVDSEFSFASYVYGLYVALLLMLTGSVTSFVSPIGGFVQAAGVIGFVAGYGVEYSWGWVWDILIPNSPGLLFAIAASVTAISGLVWGAPPAARIVRSRTSRRFRTFWREDDISAGAGKESRYSRSVAIDRYGMLAVAGSILGIVSVTFAWLVGEWPYNPDEEMGSLIIGAPAWEFIPNGVGLAGAVFLVGSVLAFVTYLGAAVQVFGLVAFYTIARNNLGEYTVTGYYSYSDYTGLITIGIGFYIGIVSVVIIVFSWLLRTRTAGRWSDAFDRKNMYVWRGSANGSPSDARPVREPGDRRYTVNVLSALGIALGLISILGSWFVIGFGMPASVLSEDSIGAEPMCKERIPTVSSWDLLGPAFLTAWHPLLQLAGVAIFLLGLSIAFFSQFGGVLQVLGLGISAFVMNYDLHLYVYLDSRYPISVLGFGFFLAAASAALIIVSSFVHVTLAARSPFGGRLGRLLTFRSLSDSTEVSQGQPTRISVSARSPWSILMNPSLPAVVGSVAGLVSLSLPWAINELSISTVPSEVISDYQTWKLTGLYPLTSITIISLTMLVASLLSLLTPLGGLFQAVAVAWFTADYLSAGDLQPSWGFAVALFAAAMTLVSLAATLYANWGSRPSLVRNLLLTWSAQERASLSQK